jgi:hypothetical protein
MVSTAFYTTYLQVVPCKRIATTRRSIGDTSALESSNSDTSLGVTEQLMLF